MTGHTIQHQWEQQTQGAFKGYWICEHCRYTSRTRRKPSSDGCAGPIYEPEDLQQWSWDTERLPNGGINLLLVHPTERKKIIRHFSPGHILTALWIEQFVAKNRSPEWDTESP